MFQRVRRARRLTYVAVRAVHRARQLINVVNLTTPVGLLTAFVGRARLQSAPDGLILARGYQLAVPAAPAFTVGNVVLLKIDDAQLALRPRLLEHEARHASQYAVCLGLLMPVMYFAAAGWSWLRCRDFATHNVFERHAGLSAGGYPTVGYGDGSSRPRRGVHGRAGGA